MGILEHGIQGGVICLFVVHFQGRAFFLYRFRSAAERKEYGTYCAIFP